MFTNDNPLYTFQDSELWFCDEAPYLNLFLIGVALPAFVLMLYYILYRGNFMPFISSVKKVWYVLAIGLLLISGIGSYNTVINFCYPENLLCEKETLPAEEAIDEYINDHGVSREVAIKALLQTKGYVISDIAGKLAGNNFVYTLLTIVIVSFIFRYFSIHARYSPIKI
jgi:hypothetical protein